MASLESRLARSWKRIARWHEQAGASSFQLAPAATDKAIASLERAIGETLPDDVRASLTCHDGGLTDATWILTYGDLLPTQRIASQWALNQDLEEDWDEGDRPSAIRGPIKPTFWSSKRIPLTDNGGNALMIDLDPPKGGKRGQVIKFDHEIGPSVILASSWLEFLERWADDLEARKYVYFARERVVALPGAYGDPSDALQCRLVAPSTLSSWEIKLVGDTIQIVEGLSCSMFTPGAALRDSAARAARARKEYDALVAAKRKAGYIPG